MPIEIELKLEVTSEAATAIGASDLLRDEPSLRSQRALYFDTPARDLAKAGMSLRIRQENDTRIQTVKASGGTTAGLFARSEWEQEVDTDVPILDDTTPIRSVLGREADDIAPIFQVAIERRSWTVEEGGSVVELVIDRGRVEAGDRTARIVEIELELKSGTPAALFAVAHRLDAIAPVRLGVLTKSERGYRLSDAPRAAIKAGHLTLRHDMTSAEAFQTIVHACIRHFRLNEALLVQSREADALHQSRVALRRLRSGFSIFKPILADPEGRRLQEELRWLAGELGSARNLDVLLERTEPGELRDRIAGARERSYDHVQATLAHRRARAVMLDLAEWTADGAWLDVADTASDRTRPVQDFASRALDRFRKKVKKDGRDLSYADDHARHEVRKDSKKLRYAAEFFRSLFDRKNERRRYKAFIAALENLQEQLGALNDLATAPEVLNGLGLTDHIDVVSAAARQKSAMIEAAAEAYENLVDTKRFW
ncbi:inorganic triphosphatase [Sphingomonas sp. AP4-R1]|uniref:CYTH and CHAD domain-containing protein n=1 Tax=Sphingomonas sp. AP4-R1 TaxID=2735134 RepID=UPI0014936510|nr:CHAD domain-containing protein [Sphingomonas sp. AP4-R1]QJU59266.1 inorganic triphosphatase [Sphingomonas sp. AP4-R1]